MDEADLTGRLGKAVKAHRLRTGLSQDKFADTIGMHRAYFSAIERGERNVTLVTMNRVARGLGVKLADLIRTAGL